MEGAPREVYDPMSLRLFVNRKKIYLIFLVTKIMKQSLGDALELKETN